MSIKAAVKYIDCRLNAREEELLFRSITAEYIAVLVKNMRLEKTISFYDGVKKIYGFESKEDNRTAKEIIADTVKSMGLTLVE